MPSLVPLNNAIAQSSVDFNNQTPANAGGLFRYKINNYSGNRTLNSDDINAVCVCTHNTVLLLTTSFTNLKVNSEIIFYSSNGYVRVQPSVGVNLYFTDGYYTKGPSSTGGVSSVSKLIYAGSNNWFLAGYNMSPSEYTWTNCCSSSSTLYQLKTSSAYDINARAYTNSDLTIPYNGIVSLEAESTTYYYKLINGWPTSGTGCVTDTYSTPYTFYTGADPVEDAVIFYSVSGLTPSSYSTLLGNKFFTADVGAQHDCYTTDMVSPGTQTSYYGSTAQYGSSSPAIFKDGYVVNIN